VGRELSAPTWLARADLSQCVLGPPETRERRRRTCGVLGPARRRSAIVPDMDVTLQRHALGLTWVERNAMARAAHALTDEGRVWLIDPYENAQALAAVAELGTPAGVIQLLDRHKRDCEAIAQRLGVALHRLPQDGVGPFTPVRVISNRAWREVALWWPSETALVVAEAVGTGPAFCLGRRVGVHPMLRLLPPRAQLLRYEPERLFVGHGEAIESGAGAALREALDHARSDTPRLILSLPKLIRGGA
jgi:hypothetical protein